MAKQIVCRHCGAHLATDYRDSAHRKYVDWDGQLLKHRYPKCNERFFSCGDGTGICEECLEKHYARCASCGRVLRPNENHSTVLMKRDYWSSASEGILCDYCRKFCYKPCSNCGILHRSAELSKINDKLFCTKCCEDLGYERCDGCGGFCKKENMAQLCIYHGGKVRRCETCIGALQRQGYLKCKNCGSLVHPGSVVYKEEEPYCPHCHEAITPRIIHPYHGYSHIRNKENPEEYIQTFRPDDFNSQRHSVLSLGVEIEMDKGGCDPDKAQEIAKALGHPLDDFKFDLYCSRDGSLREGMEFIPQPMPLERLLTFYDWEKGFKTAIRLQMRAHDTDTCGLHVHMDRTYFEGSRVNPELGLLIIFLNNMSWLRVFSRRKNFTYCAFYNPTYPYLKRIFLPLEAIDVSFLDGKRLTKSQGKKNPGLDLRRADVSQELQKIRRVWTSHSQAINFYNSGTIELRFFRGTLKTSTFIAVLQFVNMMGFAAKNFTAAQMTLVNLRWFINLAKKRGYSEFVKYTGTVIRRAKGR